MRPSPHGAHPPADRRLHGAVAVALLAACAAAAWVWVTAGVATWLHAGRWTPGPLRALPGVLAALPRHMVHPGAAWPPSVARRLPGSYAIVGVAAGIGVAGAVAVYVAALATRRGRHRGWTGGLTRPDGYSSAAGGAAPGGLRRSAPRDGWARPRDLRQLLVRRPTGGRLVLGRLGRRLVAAEARHSVLVIGPTQSGKTSGLAVPAALEWPGPVVATSVKGDLAAATLPYRRRLGRCWVFDPTAGTDLPERASWSPLGEASGWRGAQRVAAWMVDATPARAGLGDGAFWYSAAAKLLAPMLLAANLGDLGMAEVVRWNDTSRLEEPLTLLEMAGEAAAAVALQACAARDERLRSSVATTLETVLAPFADPAVAEATAGSDIDLELLLDGPHTLHLVGPAHEQARVQGLFATLVSSVVAAAVERAGRRGAPLDPPLLLILDEVANIAPVHDLDGLASTAAGIGVQLVTVCQDLAQLTARYGADRARTIANNHRAKLVLSGVSDLATLDLVSGLAGDRAVREHTDSRDLSDGRRSRSTATAYRRVAPTSELRQLPPGRAVLVYGHLLPARIRLRPWFADRTLRRRGAPSS